MGLVWFRTTDSYGMDPRPRLVKDKEYIEELLEYPKYTDHKFSLNFMLKLIDELIITTKNKHHKNLMATQIDFLAWEIERDLYLKKNELDMEEYQDFEEWKEIQENIQSCKNRIELHKRRIQEYPVRESLRRRITNLISRFGNEKEVGFEFADKTICESLMSIVFAILDNQNDIKKLIEFVKMMFNNFPELNNKEFDYKQCGLMVSYLCGDGYTREYFKLLAGQSTVHWMYRLKNMEDDLYDKTILLEIMFLCIYLLERKVFGSKNEELTRAIYDYMKLCNFLGE